MSDTSDEQKIESTSSHPGSQTDEKPRTDRGEDRQQTSTPRIKKSAARTRLDTLWSRISANFHWIPQNNTWSKWKTVIRCALAAWVCGILFIIPKTENAMGQVRAHFQSTKETYV